MNKPDLERLGRLDAWDGVRAVVAGIGVSGFAAADNLTHLGAHVTALDESDAGDRGEKGTAARDPRRGRAARPRRRPRPLPDDVHLVVTSPGWPPSAPLLAQAAARGIPVWGEVELAWRLRDPEPPRAVALRHRHQRQDHDRADARRDPACARPAQRRLRQRRPARSSRR